MADTFLNIPNNGSASWKDPVAAVINLPTIGNTIGDARIVTSLNAPYVWSGTAWVAAGGGGGGGITALTGDVTASGTGSVAATIANNAVTNAKMATAPTLTLKGNNTGSTGNVADLTVLQVNTMLTPAEFNAGTLGATPTFNFANGPAQRGTLSADATVTLSGAVSGGAYVIKIIQDTTPRTVTWPASVRWAGGTAPVISTGSGAIDLINLYFDGTNYYGSFAQAFA